MTSGLSALPPIGGWSIVSQQQQTRAVPGSNGPVPGYMVSFVTGYGTNGSVFIPNPQYTVDNVKAAVAAQVAALDAVSVLTHTS